MKIPRLLATALASAGAWAEAPKPQGFFIKVGAGYRPLSYDEKSPSTSAFMPWPDQNPSGVMLKRISENSFYAKTRSGVVGFHEADLSHGPELEKAAWTVDPDSKLVHLDVFFCEPSGKVSQHMKDNEECSPVELYLSPFDSRTGQISLGQDLSVEPATYVPAANIPHTLFAELTRFGGPKPIVTSSDGTMFVTISELFQPERFYYENGVFFTKDPAHRHVGIEANKLVHSSSSSPFGVTLPEDNPSVYGLLFACDTTHPSILQISHTDDTEGANCQKILLTYSPYQGSGKKADAHSALPESEVYMPNTHDNPLAFFAKVGGTHHALSATTSFQRVNALSYGVLAPPIEIKLEGDHAVPINTINTEPVGFAASLLALGPSHLDQKLRVDLDDNGMLKGHELFSCNAYGAKYFEIVRNRLPGFACFKVDMYVGRLKRQTGEYIKFSPHQPEGDDNNESDGSGKSGTLGPVDGPKPSEGKAPTPKDKDQDKHGSQSPSKGTGTDEHVSPGGETGQDSHPEAPKADDGSERGRSSTRDAPGGHEPADGDNKGNEPTEEDKPEKGPVPAAEDNSEKSHVPAKKNKPEKDNVPAEKDKPEKGPVPAEEDNSEKSHVPAKKNKPEKGPVPAEEDKPEEGHEPRQKSPEEEHEPKQKSPEEEDAPTDNAHKGEEPKAKDEPGKGHEPKQKRPEDEHEPKQKIPEEEYPPTDNGDMAKDPKDKDLPAKGHEPKQKSPDKELEPKQKNPEENLEPKQKRPEEELEPEQKNPEDEHEPKQKSPEDGHEPKQKKPEEGHEPKQRIPEELEPKQKSPEEGDAPTDNAHKGEDPKAKDEPEKDHEPKQKSPEEEHAPTDNGDMGKDPKEKNKPEKGHVPTEGEDKEPGQKSPVPEKDEAQVRKSPVSKPDHKAESGSHSEDVPATDALPNVPGASRGSGSRSSNSKINGMVHGASDVSSTSQGSNVTFSDTRMHRTYNSTHISVSNTSEFRFHDIFHLTNRTRVTNIRNGDCPECGDVNIADVSGQHARPIREAASPTTFCAECNAATKIVWNTCTDYTTYCPQKTTLTISKCEDVCSQTRVTVSAPTMFTCPGVCIIPETIAEGVPRSGVEAATAVHVAVETGDARGAINAPNRVSPLFAEGRKSSESTKDHKPSRASSEQGVKSEQGNRAKEKEAGSRKHEISSEKEAGSQEHVSSEKEAGSQEHVSSEKEVGSQKHVSSDEQKFGANKENRKGKEHGPEKRPSVGSSDKGNAPKEQSSDAPKPKAARLTGDSARSSKTRPAEPDETSTSTLTKTVTRPGVTPYDNGASRTPVGAFLFVLASLLM